MFSLPLISVSLLLSQDVPPWMHPAWDSVLPGLGSQSPTHVREAFSYFLFKDFLRSFLTLSLSSSGTPIMQILMHLLLSRGLLDYPYFFSFFSTAVIYIILTSQPHTPTPHAGEPPILTGKSGLISYKDDDSFLCVLVHRRLCECPPRMAFISPVLWNSCD